MTLSYRGWPHKVSGSPSAQVHRRQGAVDTCKHPRADAGDRHRGRRQPFGANNPSRTAEGIRRVIYLPELVQQCGLTYRRVLTYRTTKRSPEGESERRSVHEGSGGSGCRFCVQTGAKSHQIGHRAQLSHGSSSIRATFSRFMEPRFISGVCRHNGPSVAAFLQLRLSIARRWSPATATSFRTALRLTEPQRERQEH